MPRATSPRSWLLEHRLSWAWRTQLPGLGPRIGPDRRGCVIDRLTPACSCQHGTRKDQKHMEPSRFDELTKGLAAATSRRQALKTIAATTVGSILGLTGLRTAFAKPQCKPNGHGCGTNKQCCSGYCDPTTSLCACQPGTCTDTCPCPSGQNCCNGTCSDCPCGQVKLCDGSCATPCSDPGGSCSGSCGSGLCGPHLGGPGGPLCSSDTGNSTLCFTDCDCSKVSCCGR